MRKLRWMKNRSIQIKLEVASVMDQTRRYPRDGLDRCNGDKLLHQLKVIGLWLKEQQEQGLDLNVRIVPVIWCLLIQPRILALKEMNEKKDSCGQPQRSGLRPFLLLLS